MYEERNEIDTNFGGTCGTRPEIPHGRSLFFLWFWWNAILHI